MMEAGHSDSKVFIRIGQDKFSVPHDDFTVEEQLGQMLLRLPPPDLKADLTILRQLDGEHDGVAGLGCPA